MSSSRRAPERLARAWSHVRAALILAAILLGMIDGIPPPAPEMKGELAETIRRGERLRKKILAPFRPVPVAFKLAQGFRLFPAGEVHPLRLIVDGRDAGGTWRVLYTPLDPAHRFLGDALEYRRLRGSWDPTTRGPRGTYDAVVSWIAARAFGAYPDLVEVRTRMEVLTVAPGVTSVTSEGRYLYARTRKRPRTSP